MNRNSLYGNKYVNIIDDQLYLGKVRVRDLITQYDTPTFVFIAEKIQENIVKIKQIFESEFSDSYGFYSIKSNYLPEIVKIVQKMDFGAEIISNSEYRLLNSLNFEKEKIITGGPYMPDSFLQNLIDDQISHIVCYDIETIIQIQQMAEKRTNYRQKIIIRFTTPKYTGRQGVIFTPENIELIIATLNKCPNVILNGILSHIGTQLNTQEDYLVNFEFLIKIATEFRKFNLNIKIFNIGGGFPNADSLKTDFLKDTLRSAKELLKNAGFDEIRLFYEPGRFIIGDCGFCIAKIHRYESAYKTAFLDIGNQFIPKFMKSSLRFYSVEHIEESPNTPIDFLGPIPSDQDILIKNYNFIPSVKPNDHIVIANVGAYALTFSTRFPYPIPTILLIESEQVRMIFQRESEGDITLV
jgi:diaminopimelate decarboxylase